MANFLQALEWMEKGHKVRINHWGNKEYFWWVPDYKEFTFDNLWCIKQPDKGEACMILSFVLSNDWVICDELKPKEEDLESTQKTGRKSE